MRIYLVAAWAILSLATARLCPFEVEERPRLSQDWQQGIPYSPDDRENRGNEIFSDTDASETDEETTASPETSISGTEHTTTVDSLKKDLTPENVTTIAHTCTGHVGRGRDYIIIFDRSGLADKDKMIALTEGLLDMINPWNTNNRLALISYARDVTVDVDFNSITSSREKIMKILKGYKFQGAGDLMLAMRTANKKILDTLPWLETTDREKVVIMFATESVGGLCSPEWGKQLIKSIDGDGGGGAFDDCMQRGYAHQSALMTAKYEAKIFLVTVGFHLLNELKYITPMTEIVGIQNIEKFTLDHPLDEFSRRFCHSPHNPI